jgi:uracil-DNA glycosylase
VSVANNFTFAKQKLHQFVGTNNDFERNSKLQFTSVWYNISKEKKENTMPYYFPFGQELHPLVQEDKSPKKVFVLGVYASAVHARWKIGGQVVCQALAVASEPRIFWDGNEDEARAIIGQINIPKELGYLEPAGKQLNGPSAKVLDENILAPLGFTRNDAWLCDCLPETRINPSQAKAIKYKYNPLIEQYHLNPVTIPARPSAFCDKARSIEITEELMQSEAELLILLGDIPIAQYLKKVADIPYSTLGEYVDMYGYGTKTDVVINGKTIEVLPLAHPRQIGALGAHSEKWFLAHREWEKKK